MTRVWAVLAVVFFLVPTTVVGSGHTLPREGLSTGRPNLSRPLATVEPVERPGSTVFRPVPNFDRALPFSDSSRFPAMTNATVQNTLDLLNNTLVNGSSLPANCLGPAEAVVDYGKGETIVSCQNTGALAILNDSTGSLVSEIALGVGTTGIAYSPVDGEIFVTDYRASVVYVMNDTSDSVMAKIPVGLGPSDATYDPDNREVYVANFDSNNVSALSDTTGKVVSNIPVGNSPVALVFDSVTKQIFVSNELNNSISVINDSTNTVVKTVNGIAFPWGLAYAAKLGEVFVANYHAQSVMVVSDKTDARVATIAVGNTPQGLVYDSGTGEVFVANSAGNSLSIINASARSVTDTVGSDYLPVSFAYDSLTGELFVVNANSDNVTVLSDTSNKVVKSIRVGVEPGGVAYDPAADEAFVTLADADSVDVISESTGKVIGSVNVGHQPENIVYDSGSNQLFVVNEVVDSVSVISVSSMSVVATVSTLTLGTMDVIYDAGVGEVFLAVQFDNNVTIISDQNDTVVAKIPISSPDGLAYDPTKGQVFVSSVFGNLVDVVSDATNKVVATLNVGGGPLGLAFDSSRSEIFAVNGSFVNVVSVATSSLVASIPIGVPPGGIVYDPSSGQILVGGTYKDNLSVISDASNIVLMNLTVGSGPGIFTYDSGNGDVLVGSYWQGTVAMVGPFEPFPPRVTARADRLSGISPCQVNFTASASGGTGTYSKWQWHLGDGNTSTLENLSHTYTSPGNYTVWVNVTDSRGGVGTSNLLSINVTAPIPPLSVTSFTSAPNPASAGNPVDFVTTARGGVPPYSYWYSGLPPGCVSVDSTTLICTPTAAGNYSVNVKVNDSSGRSALRGFTLEVVPELRAISISPPSRVINTSGLVSFSANATCFGGPCPSTIVYQWSMNNSLGQLSTTTSTQTQFKAGGTPGEVHLTVDATWGNVSVLANASITIVLTHSKGPATPTVLGLPGYEGYLLIGVAIAAVLIGLVWIWKKARKNSDTEESSQGSAGPPSEPPAA